MSIKFELAGGWHLLRVEVNGRPEWIICDPAGDRLGDTDKHKSELDRALLAELGDRSLPNGMRETGGPS